MDSLGQIAQPVSVCEKGIILQSHERGDALSIQQRAY